MSPSRTPQCYNSQSFGNMDPTGGKLLPKCFFHLRLKPPSKESPKEGEKRNRAVFAAGDYNAKNRKWNCPNTCKIGAQLARFADKTDAKIIAPDEPTHYNNRSASTIDLALVRNIKCRITAETINELSSDHLPVKFWLDTGSPAENSRKFIPNWKMFKRTILAYPEIDYNPADETDIDEEVRRLTNEIVTAYQESGKWKENKRRETTEEIREQIKTRNRLRKIWQRTRHPADKNNLNRAQNYLSKMQYEREQKNWGSYIESLDPAEGSLWETGKNIRKINLETPHSYRLHHSL
ncbi:putative RNA-directed DNA polymerase like protein [Argiope bruennichi]|uniref:Putative RNA-directed DNA polymerase like protein n=1 Tax=Argiope bruennichi TaxID=94029 RepID=A0A8T0F476_ARGBR|nr:putative RNA-directed DNA polymerase like protein [Argiope bruennichi]